MISTRSTCFRLAGDSTAMTRKGAEDQTMAPGSASTPGYSQVAQKDTLQSKITED